MFEAGQDLKGSDLTLYMRTTLGEDRNHWYNSRKDLNPQEVELIKAPEFLLASSEVSLQQRRRCCCSKRVTVRLPLDPGDDQNRKRQPCQTIGEEPDSCSHKYDYQRATSSYDKGCQWYEYACLKGQQGYMQEGRE
eukprot:GHVU01080479.1.p1 GENE.GHVU01080479.1~~GHVU01080479.1.p1  ORF type:complete len:136 (-),score=13.85 GHVU01080479.1:79-486(-)